MRGQIWIDPALVERADVLIDPMRHKAVHMVYVCRKPIQGLGDAVVGHEAALRAPPRWVRTVHRMASFIVPDGSGCSTATREASSYGVCSER